MEDGGGRKEGGRRREVGGKRMEMGGRRMEDGGNHTMSSCRDSHMTIPTQELPHDITTS